MLHGIKLRKIVCILTHYKIRSMTLLLKLFLFHILYACGNKITPFSSVCVNGQNFKILNLNCTVLLTLGVIQYLDLFAVDNCRFISHRKHNVIHDNIHSARELSFFFIYWNRYVHRVELHLYILLQENVWRTL